MEKRMAAAVLRRAGRERVPQCRWTSSLWACTGELVCHGELGKINEDMAKLDRPGQALLGLFEKPFCYSCLPRADDSSTFDVGLAWTRVIQIQVRRDITGVGLGEGCHEFRLA